MGEQGWGGSVVCRQLLTLCTAQAHGGGGSLQLRPGSPFSQSCLERQAGLTAALHFLPVLSLSTSGVEISDSQEYRSTSNTAVMSPEHSRKNRENLGLSRAPKVTQATENLNQKLETTPAYGQRRHSSKAEATQSPKPRKTEPPQRPGRQGPRQATEGPKPRKNRPALTPKQRLRRDKAIRAQSWKPKSQGHSQKPTKTSSETVSSSSSETQDQSSGPSSSEDTSSSSGSTASSSSKTDEPSLQDSQDGNLSSSKTEPPPGAEPAAPQSPGSPGPEPELQQGKAFTHP